MFCLYPGTAPSWAGFGERACKVACFTSLSQPSSSSSSSSSSNTPRKRTLALIDGLVKGRKLRGNHLSNTGVLQKWRIM